MKATALGWVSAACLCLAGAARAATPAVADLEWLTGHWVDRSGNSLSEEVWVAPAGDGLAGMWRWVVDGHVKLYELLTIRADPEGLVMRLRHFDGALVGWEEKDAPLALKLLSNAPGEVVFEGVEHDGRVRLTYRRAGPDSLMGVLETTAPGKPPAREEFRYRRVAP